MGLDRLLAALHLRSSGARERICDDLVDPMVTRERSDSID